MDQKQTDWYARKGLTPPSHTSHGLTADDISKELKQLKPHSWRLEGNRLIAKTEMGELVNHIDPSYILTGVDKNNLPTFKKVSL